mgnify:CR=1 FL=1
MKLHQNGAKSQYTQPVVTDVVNGRILAARLNSVQYTERSSKCGTLYDVIYSSLSIPPERR